MLTFEISGAQIDGARDYQEDAFLITHLADADAEGGSLVIVADGMGGHAAGNVASNMAVQTFNKHVTSHFPSDRLPEVLRESVEQANNSISETVRETAALKGMGCTLVAAVLADKFIRWVSVGDSHLYLIRNGEMKKKNADHSYGGFLDRMAAEGTPVEAEAGFSRNMLMSALTGEEIAEIDCPETPLELQVGDRVVVATDGLDTLSIGKILSFSADAGSAKECVDALLKGVAEANMPRQDNTTVVIIDVGEKPDNTVTQTAVTMPAADQVEQSYTPPPAPAPFTVEPEEPPRSGKGLALILALLLLAGSAGAGYWYFTQTGTEHSVSNLEPDDSSAADDIVIDEEIVEDELVDTVADTPTPDEAAEVPAPAPAPAQPKVPVGEPFADALSGGGTGPAMMWLPAGEFQMGARDSAAAFDERPQHKVSISAFAISKFEISIAQYTRFARATSRRIPKTGDLDAETHPVFFVSWDDAVAYTRWLSTQTGKTYRLPTEAEWEYAARGGTTTAYYWGRNLGADNAHCFACETGLDPRRPTKLGRFAANPFGVHDLAGNVEEWVADCYNRDYQAAPNDGSVFPGGDCTVRVIRGGAFSSGPKALRSSARNTFRFDSGNDSIGIRVVREP